MKKTRNLFLLVGSPAGTQMALEAINFKGLITVPYWTPCQPEDVEKHFKNNKSVVCSRDDFVGKFPKNAIILNVVPTARSSVCNASNTIYLKDSETIANQFENIAISLNLDIGDHKSNASGLSDAPTKKDCAYCQYLDGDVHKNERPVYRSENFFVIPTIGQFVNGYLLIIPNAHIMSNAELSSEHLEEFYTVLNDIEFILKLTYPNFKEVLVWENGSGSGGKGKAKDSVVHSHVHVALSDLTSHDIKALSGFDFEEIELKDLAIYKSHSYLLVKNPDNEKWIINNNPEVYIPRQYVRQLIAEEYGIQGEAWNWRTHPFEEKMHQTVDTIIAALEKNQCILSERIRNRTRFLFDAN